LGQDSGPKALPLKHAYAFGIERGLEGEIAEIRGMDIEWDFSYTSTLRRGYIVDLFQQRGVMAEFIRLHWPQGATPQGVSRTRRYLSIKARYEDFLSGAGDDPSDESEELCEQAFAAESDLRDFLAKNPDTIEPGLRLYSQGERDGVEYAIDGGRIDVLAIDAEGKFVVIELKLSRGRNRALGQLLHYMGWVDANLGNAPCRGIAIAREISEDLKLAASRTTGVSLFQYHLKVSLEKVL